MNQHVRVETIEKQNPKQVAPKLFMEIFFLLSSFEFMSAMLYYINHYQRIWWRRPVSISGMAILALLFNVAIVFFYIGYQLHVHPRKAVILATRLTGKLLFTPILCFLTLALVALLIIILNPSTITFVSLRVVNRHQALSYLLVLLILQAFFTLISLRFNSMAMPFIYLLQRYEKMRKKITDIKLIAFAMWMKKYEFFIVSIVFAGLVLLFFLPTLIQGKLPLSTSYLYQFNPWASYRGQFNNDMVFNNVLSDDYDSGIPAMKFLYTEIWSGKFPFWIPYANSGIPYGILMFSSIFSLHGLAVMIGGVKWGTLLYMSLKIYIAGISIYCYLRYRLFARSSAFLASLVLMFSTHLIVNGMSEVPDAVIYAPAILYFAERFVKEGKYWLFICLIVSVSATLLSGFPSVIMYTLSLVTSYLAYRNLIEFQSQQFSRRIKNITLIYLAFLIGILSLAFTLLPTYEFFKAVNIGYRIGRGPTIFESVMIGRLINPNICGNPVQSNWICSANYNESALYVGLMPIVLIPFSFINKENKSTAWFFFTAAMLILMTVFGVGSLNRIVGGLPLFNANPNTRMIALLPLCFAFISAVGMENIQLIQSSKWYWSLIYFISLGIYAFYVFDNISVNPVANEVKASYYLYQSSITMFFLLYYPLLITSSLIFKKRSLNLIILVLLLGGNFMERFLLIGGYQGASYPGTFYPETPAITFLESKMPKYERIVVIGRDFIPSFPLYFSINSLTGHAFADVAFKNNLELINPGIYAANTTQPQFGPAAVNLMSPLLDLYRVRFIVTSPSAPPIWSVIVADQREYTQSYNINDLKSFGQSITASRSGYINLLEIQMSIPGVRSIPANVTLRSGDDLLADFNGLLSMRENGYYSVEIPKLQLMKGQVVSFEVTPIKGYLSLNSSLFASGYDNYDGGSLLIDRKEVDGDMAFALLQYNPAIEKKYELVHSGDLNIYENIDLKQELPVVDRLIYSGPDSCAPNLNQIDPSIAAIVEDSDLKIAESGIESRAWIREYASNRLIIDADIQQTSMVILSDTYEKGWRATVDGKQTKIYRVNCAMRGVVVEPGRHIIKMDYTPPSFRLGLSISLFTVSCLGLAGLFIKIKDPV